MNLKNLIKVAKEVQKEKSEEVEAVSKGTRIFLEFWGIVLMIISFTSVPVYWNIVSFIIGSFMYIRGRQLE